MKRNLRSLTLLIALAAAGGVGAHGDEKNAASAPPGHSHGDSDAIGVVGEAAKVTRTVKVDMTDNMRFNPSRVTVKQGETIRFVVKNAGQVKHEFVLGTDKELKEHYEVMKKFPEMEHADPNMVTVAPGKTGEVIWQFTKGGRVEFACLQPGHYDAGMKGAVLVTGAKDAAKGDGHSDHKH